MSIQHILSSETCQLKKGYSEKVWLTIEAVLVELAGIIINDDLWWS